MSIGYMVREVAAGLEALAKLLRFSRIYGPHRALFKAFGRLRIGWAGSLHIGPRRAPGIAIVGCGQFAFATIAYFLRGSARLVGAFDLDIQAARSFARFYGVAKIYDDTNEAMHDKDVDCVYVASNHASHAQYAVAALGAGKNVYVEKPVAVSHAQLAAIGAALKQSDRRIFAGYNRPFSAAVRDFRTALGAPSGPLTMSCFVAGHVIGDEHWYRRPEEGTRICGNVGHWLDLAVHLVSWRNLPDRWVISLCWSDSTARDDNVAISLASEAGDLVSIVLSARSEPFEGINETINLQWDDLIAKIDDFRTQTFWKGSRLVRKRYWPKDVGHRSAILQPFGKTSRPWCEIENSTLLMLRITEMVRASEPSAVFSFAAERRRIDKE